MPQGLRHGASRRLLTLTLLLLAFAGLQAQTKISGKVTDAQGEPLPGANVYVKDSYDGATTDTSGVFSFTCMESGTQTLVVSYIGYETFEEAIELGGTAVEVNPQLKEEFNTTNTVLITAGGFGANDESKAIVLNPLDIVTTAGALGDVFGALQFLPGTQAVGEENGLFVRGGSAAETVTIIDEMIVQQPFFSSVPDIPGRSRFNPFLFKGTFFSTGAYSARYGQALSSALILNSQDMPDTSSGAINLLPIGGGGFYTKKWANTALTLSANYTDVAPLFVINKQRADWEIAPRAENGSLIFRHKPNKDGIFKWYTSYNHQRFVVKDFFPVDSAGNLGTVRTKLGSHNFYNNASYRHLLNDNWVLFAGASYSFDTDDLEVNSDDIGQQDMRGQGKLWFSRGIGKNSKVWFGGEGHYIDTQQNFNTFENRAEDIYTAGFVESEIYLSTKLAARLGGRLEHSTLLDRANVAPRASLAYKLGKTSTASLAFGQFFQNPSTEFTFWDPTLNYENATHYLANYTYSKGKRTFRVEGYYKTYGNLVRFFNDSTSINGLAYDNGGDGYATGVDVFWRDQETIPSGDYWISYSYLDTEREYRDYPTAATPFFASTHNFSVVYKQYVAKLRTSVGASYNMATGRTYRIPGDIENPETFLTNRTPNYHMVALNASYLTTIKDNFTVFFFSLNNVLGRNNVFGYRYSPDGQYRQPTNPAQRRSFFLGVFILIR